MALKHPLQLLLPLLAFPFECLQVRPSPRRQLQLHPLANGEAEGLAEQAFLPHLQR